MYVIQIYTCRENTHTHKINESKNKNKYKETGKMHLEPHTQQQWKTFMVATAIKGIEKVWYSGKPVVSAMESAVGRLPEPRN